ncbi:DsbA family protein [Phormidium tenue FACHB-886]|nr:DsbA family protein [Phormidium tenue FACHB-886]
MNQTDDNRLLIPIAERDHIQGLINAPVTLVEYGDYQCFQCSKFHQAIEAIQQFNSSLCFVFRHFPQVQIHPQSQRAAEAAEAASSQGHFWQMHDVLLKHQYALDDSYLVEYANELGLNIPQFLTEISGQVHADRVFLDLKNGRKNGITRTPTLFINGFRYQGAWDSESFYAAISQAKNNSHEFN